MAPQSSEAVEIDDDTANHSDHGATDAHDHDSRGTGRMKWRRERECHENRINMRSV